MSNWRDEALCAQVDGELFFPEKGQSTREAKQTCNGRPARGMTPATEPCPARAECLAWAIATEQQFGVWGGLTLRERRALEGEEEAA